jgi:membrane protease YdiL (CAAX protease family)
VLIGNFSARVAPLGFGAVRWGLADVGLGQPRSWPMTFGLALGWTLLMLPATRFADRIATRLFTKPPTLGAFRSIQASRAKLVLGIAIAWLLGAFLEELVLRGLLLRGLDRLLVRYVGASAAIAVAVAVAASSAFVIHLYQGLRAAFIVAQLSVLFGVLFVISRENLWTVVLCHGCYDTVAFIRFAKRSSKYSKLDAPDGR